MMTVVEKGRAATTYCRIRLSALLPRVERNVVFELRRQDPVNMPPRSAELHLVPVTLANVEGISRFRHDGIVDLFRRFLAEGEIGVYAYWGDMAVGHAWAGLWHGSPRLVWGYLPVTSGTACIYFCSVSPSYRGRRIYQNMLVELIRVVCVSTPVRRIMISCELDNRPSYSAIERVGFRRLLVLPVLCWRGHRIRLATVPDTESDIPDGLRS